MTVTLEPPLTTSGVWRPHGAPPNQALAAGPAYVTTDAATRWHRVRSGYILTAQGRRIWHLWCGQSTSDSKHGYRETDDPTSSVRPACGTCEGRYLGASPDRPDLLYSPRRLTPPKVCPSSQGMRFVQELTYNRGICLVCCKPVKLRGYGGWHGGGYGAQRHAPGLDLVPGCPFHAWRELTVIDGQITCSCQAPNDQTET